MAVEHERPQRRMFGPLTYVMLALLVICTPFGVALRVIAWIYQPARAVTVDPRTRLDSAVGMLRDGDASNDLAAVDALAEARLYFVDNAIESIDSRARVDEAFHEFLPRFPLDVQTHAVKSLSHQRRLAPPLIGDLTALLNHEDLGLRLAAARTLVRTEGSSTAGRAGLDAIVAMASDPLTPDLDAAMMALVEAGEPGIEAALKIVVDRLDDPAHDVRIAAAHLAEFVAPSVDRERFLRAIDARLHAPDPAVRATAALAGMAIYLRADANSTIMLIDPRLETPLAEAVVAPSIPYPIRVHALQSLIMPGNDGSQFGMAAPGMMGASAGNPATAAIVRRCGQALARQIEAPTHEARLNAAALLMMIAPETLAGEPEEADVGSGSTDATVEP